MRQLFRALLLTLTTTTIAAAAQPAASPPPATQATALTAEQARQALQVLDDPHRRAQIEETLRAIAAADAPRAGPAVTAATPASGSSSNSAAAAAPGTISPNGLVSQLIHQGAMLAVQTGVSLRRSIEALLDIPSVLHWWRRLRNTASERSAMASFAWTLCSALLPALGIVWLAQRLLRRLTAAPLPPPATAGVISPSNDGAELSKEAEGQHHAAVHLSLLSRLPRAAFNLLLELLPLVAFVAATSLMMSILAAAGRAPDRAVDSLIEIYVVSRLIVIMSRFLFRPYQPSLRLVRMSDRSAAFAHRWVVRIVSVIAAGSALAATAFALGLSEDAYLALMKVVALIGHVMIAIWILQGRARVAARIRTGFAANQSLVMFGNALADSWAFIAVFFVMALWFVWALDVRSGYRALEHVGSLTIAILLVARLVSILAFGAVAKLFQAEEEHAHRSLVHQHAYRYYPLLRRLLGWCITIVTAILMLQVWGANVLVVFRGGTIVHRFTTTLVTIAVAAAVALFVWEWVNVAVERRLNRWTKENDLARAARLRTLQPMLRAALVLAIAPVVLLIALSDLGVNIGPLLAGASIFGVALGFGSQKLVQDVITGIFLLTDNSMQVGDWVTLAGVSGTVEHLSIRTVRLRGSDGSLYTVPFSSVSTVNNTNRGLGIAIVKVGIAYGQDIDLAIATLKEIGAALREDKQFKDGILSDFTFWGVDQLDGAAVTLSGQIECLDSARWSVQREFNRRILDQFQARGIQIANPQRTVMVSGNDAAPGADSSAVNTSQAPPAPKGSSA
jgi:moderate conductance mechanosensitive channel